MLGSMAEMSKAWRESDSIIGSGVEDMLSKVTEHVGNSFASSDSMLKSLARES